VAGQNSIDEFTDGCFVRHIHRKSFERRRIRTGRVFQRAEFLILAIRDNYLCTLLEKCKADRPPKAPRATGDHDHASSKADVQWKAPP
jgi:hypothetical protein